MEINDIKNKAIQSIKEHIRMEINDDFEKDDNLIERGLSSIMIMKVSNKLRKSGIRISFSKLMEKPTFNEWEMLIKSAKINDKFISKEEETVKNKEYVGIKFPLTDVQYAYWVGREDDQVLGGVGCHAYLEIDGKDINVKKLNEAWIKLQKDHPMLRAKFNGDGTQEIMESPYADEISVYNLENLDNKEIKDSLNEIREKISHRKLNVEEGEVAGLGIALLPEGKTRIFLDIDLLVADVMSLSIMIKELTRNYVGEGAKHSIDYTFKDYIEENKDNQLQLEEDKDFWKRKIENDFPMEAPNLPLKIRPEMVKETKFIRRKKVVDEESWSEIKRLASLHKVTPSMVLLACYGLVIERWTNQEKFLINMPLFNRDTENSNLSNMIADFTNLLLVDYERRLGETLIQTIERVSEVFLENVAHSSYSGVQVQRDMYKEIGSNNNVAPIVFACNIDYPLETEKSREALGGISYMISQTPGVWLDFQTYVTDGKLILCWDAVEELYPEELLNDMFDAFYELLISLTRKENWEKKIDVLSQRQKEIRRQEIEAIIPLKYPDERIYDGFIKNVKSNPNKVAIIDCETKEQITYYELYEISLKVADYLNKNGVEKGDYVGITLPRGSRQIYTIFGILFSGAAYVSIGIAQPNDRRSKIYNQIGIKHIISDKKTIKDCILSQDEVKIIDLDIAMANESKLEQPVEISPYDSAYIIMTSGTTGIPKGVEIMHTSAINTCIDLNEKYNVSADDTILMVSAIDFDLSVYDIFAILSAGGTIVTTSEDNYRNPDEWLNLVDEYKVTIWDSVPILFDMIVTMAEGKNRKLPFRIVMLSGDWIAINLPERFYCISENINAIVVAMGGATEASIWSNYLNVPREIPKDWISIPYGRPLKNQLYRVVDDFGRICPNYVKGELIIGGVGVAKCYHGDEELTKKKYFEKDGIRWYRTGDDGRIWNDGIIEFMGRRDKQVKIKGYRIELGEIEEAIRSKLKIKNVKVIANDKKNSLYAFIIRNVVESNHRELESNYRELLRNIIPKYMIPDKLIYINEFPINKNGKIDIKKMMKMVEEINVTCKRNPYEHSQKRFLKDVVNIFKEVTKNSHYDMNANFFENGGDSLIALNILLKLNSKYNVNLNIKDIFESNSIIQICDTMQNKMNSYENYEQECLELNEEKMPLTELQHSYWVNRVGYGNLVRQNSNFYIELECNKLDVSKINDAINKISSKYKIFRNVISDDGEYFENSNRNHVEVKYNDLCDESSKMKEKLLEDIRNRMIYLIDKEQLFVPLKVEITNIDINIAILHICFDNVFFDAPSIMYLLNELNLLYDNLDIKNISLNRGTMIQMNSNKLELDKLYWKNKISKISPAPNLLKTKNNLEIERTSGKFKRLSITLKEEQVKELLYISGKYKVTISNIILSVFSEIMHYWSRSTNYTINVIVVNNRKDIYDYFGEIADYTSNILHTINYNVDESLHERMIKIQNNLLEELQHMSFEGTQVLRELKKQSRKMYENMPVVYTNTIGHDTDISINNIGKIKKILTQTPGVYLDLQVTLVDGQYIINWDYLENIFDEKEIKEKFAIFERILLDVIEDESLLESSDIIQDGNFYEEGML